MPHKKVYQNLDITLSTSNYHLIILFSFDGNDEFCRPFIKTER
jgi:hypothetical protein